jgi:uncharacterized protein
LTSNILSQDLVARAEQLARKEFSGNAKGNAGGHDWWHTARVRDLAIAIARREGADQGLVDVAALLHDIDDFKYSGSKTAGPKRVSQWLVAQGIAKPVVGSVVAIIEGVSFRGAGVADPSLTLEGMCVRDADRLDALGAIGIARTFAYGGVAGHAIHDPAYTPTLHTTESAYRNALGPSISHFHEKTLLLRDRMGTHTGRLIAERSTHSQRSSYGSLTPSGWVRMSLGARVPQSFVGMTAGP